jgi:hypothetical protein
MKFAPFVLLVFNLLRVDSFNSRLKRPWDKPKLAVPSVTDRANQVLFYTDHDLEYPKETKHHVPQPHQTTRPATSTHNNNNNNNQSSSFIQHSYNNVNSTENIALNINSEFDNNNNNNNSSSNDQKLQTEIVAAIRPKDGPPKTLSSDPPIKDYLPDLLKMARVENFPGVILFHMIGTWLAVCQYQTYANPINQITYWGLLMSPPMMLTLISLLLTSSTSMLVNDYYDFKLGNDANKPSKALQRVPLAVCKKALYYLYAVALLTVTFLPGAPARFAVTGGLMLTFLYTKHVKPRTW